MLNVPLLILALALLPATYAQSSQDQPSPAPASTPERQDQASANRRIHDSISDLLTSDPVLSGAKVQVVVDDHSITLGGSVQSYPQHQRVLQLVSSYERWRKVVRAADDAAR